LFNKERRSKTYSTSAYFWARVLLKLLIDCVIAPVTIAIAYHYVGMNGDEGRFLNAVLVSECVFFAAGGFGLLYSTLIKDIQVANSMVPVLIVPLMLMSGFFRNLNSLPWFLFPFKSISIFRYGYQAAMYNEFQDSSFSPDLNPLAHSAFWPDSYELNLAAIVALGLATTFVSYVVLLATATPKGPALIAR
jgi:ATP-binding cassette, subfamily G (WHITE), eye pigment precursor transporter